MKKINYFIWGISIVLVIGIFVAINVPNRGMTIYNRADMRKALVYLNKSLPRQIGTIGRLDSFTYTEETLFCNISVFGDNNIKQIYRKYYDEYEDIIKYSILTMNGQGNMGQMFANFLNMKDLSWGFNVVVPDGEKFCWKISGADLKNFVDSCKISPTTAFQTIIDIQIKQAGLELPIKPGESRRLRSVLLNSLFGELDESCLPQSITHDGNDIKIVCNVDEKEYDIDQIRTVSSNAQNLEMFAKVITEDADIQELFGLLVISHSNLILRYEGRKTGKIGEIKLPYRILRKYSKLPKYMSTIY